MLTHLHIEQGDFVPKSRSTNKPSPLTVKGILNLAIMQFAARLGLSQIGLSSTVIDLSTIQGPITVLT
ncbi:hypothetical protein CEXT_5601 [Caerostris extrusa]|uniref:Uncharacterized protein n=1 Tax=Caerostris extrusa TaxID=172846 RepID=A0AAV4QH04_CAEEX|nr:hypothetical protein CEXT_5601 [Caerostris extrusa]